MSNVQDLRPTPHFALERELYSELEKKLYEYAGRVSVPGAIGVLELLKQHLITNTENS